MIHLFFCSWGFVGAKFFYEEHALAYRQPQFSDTSGPTKHYAGNPTINSQTVIGRYLIVASYNMLGKQLHYSLKLVKHGV